MKKILKKKNKSNNISIKDRLSKENNYKVRKESTDYKCGILTSELGKSYYE